MVQRKVTGSKPFRQHGKIAKTFRYPHQLTSGVRTDPQPDTNPIRQRPGTIGHPGLGDVGSLNQDTKFGGRSSM